MRDADLRRDAKVSSPVIGKLPRGTILTLQGESKGNFVLVEVELVDRTVEGWVDGRAIKKSEPVEDESKSRSEPEEPLIKKRKKRGVIPRDESVLLGRDASFSYGIYMGGNYGIANTIFNNLMYAGVGFQAGGFFGYFVGKQSTLGLELGYTKLAGIAADGTSGGIGLFDSAITVEYAPDRLRLFASILYCSGIGLSDFPASLPLTGASDVSSLWVKGGAGYSFPLTELINLVGKAFYGVSFTRVPVGLQSFGGSVFLEFRG